MIVFLGNLSVKKFKFSDNTIKWVETLQKITVSGVILNHYLSSEIALGMGCKQDDTVFPYIFILALEMVGIMVREKNLKVIDLHGEEHIYHSMQTIRSM